MAILYVDDAGSETSPFDTWAKAAATLEDALNDAACVAGSTVFIGHDSVATYVGNVTFTSAGTAAAPILIYSADNTSGEPPTTYTVGAIEDADDAAYDMAFSGVAICYGVTFKVGDDFQPAAASLWKFEDCELELGGTFDFWASYSITHLVNSNITPVAGTIFRTSNTDGNQFIWDGGQFLTTNPTSLTLFDINGGGEGTVVILRNVDLSIYNRANSFIFDNAVLGEGHFLLVEGCLLNGTNAPGLCKNAITSWIDKPYKMVGCHNADAPYFELAYTGGVVYHDSGEFRGGADPIPNVFSAKIVTAATYVTYHTPLRHELGHVWCSANPTLTIHLTHDVNGDGSDLQDDEFWIEIEYPDGTNQTHRRLDQSSKMSPLGTPGDLTTEGAAGWDGGGLAVDNSIAVIIGDGAKPNGGEGLHTVWVCFARAGETVYVDPQIDVS